MSNRELESILQSGTEPTENAGAEEAPKIRLPWKSLGAVVVLAAISTSGSYAYGAATAGAPKIASEVEVPEVKATVKKVDVSIEPITISTTLSKTQTHIKNTSTLEIFGAAIPVHETNFRRTANVIAEYTFDPSTVEASYDSENEQVTISVPDKALSTNVAVDTGTAETEHVTEFGIKWALDSMEQFIQYADGILGTDSSKDPILSKVIDGTLGVRETLEKIADLKAAEGVDESCTEKVRGLKGFNKALANEVLKLSTKEIVASSFLEDLEISSAERRKLIEQANLEFENGENFTIGHDDSVAKRVELYGKIFNTETTVDPVSCDVDENTKYTINGKEQTNG